MANEVYIERASGTTFRVDLGPVHMVEDTYMKTPLIENIPTDPEDASDPETGVLDTKQTIHKFTITGVLSLNDGDAINFSDPPGGSGNKAVTTLVQVSDLNDYGSKIGRLRLLYGYGSVSETKLSFNYNGIVYEGFMTRLTMTRAGGEDFYEYIIEIIEAVYIDDLTY